MTRSSSRASAAASTSNAAPQVWQQLAHDRLATALEGFDRWRREALRDMDAHAVLKLRAHARRIERFAATFATEVEHSEWREEITGLVTLSIAVIEATSALRSNDLASDYFDGAHHGLGESTASEAAAEYSDWLFKHERPRWIDETSEALRGLSLRAATRAKKVLLPRDEKGPAIPPLKESMERVSAAGRTAWEALEPLVCSFDQSAIDASRIAVRALRYTWKALKPCFELETYTLNHEHAHRLQSLLGQASDLEAWVIDAENFADHAAARRRGVRPQDWDRVLRYAWAGRLNLLHQVGRHPLVRHWLEKAGRQADMVRAVRSDLRP